jgi:fructuronate reductase
MTDRLSRSLPGQPAPQPVRAIHLGLGAFHRAHQAWYTHAANEAGDRWGIAAFTGRRPDAATALAGQDGLYTLLVRGAGGDEATVVSAISAAHDGADRAALRGYAAQPEVSVVTSTVTEAGYHRGDDGAIDEHDPAVAADIAALRSGRAAQTAPGRLLDALAARRAAGAGPISVVPCDNLSDNGDAVRAVMTSLAEAVDPALGQWIGANVAFVSTMVDRITPATTDADRNTVTQITGLTDVSPVVTEPFTEWVIADAFAGPRPQWEAGGAQLVADVTPFELRKLWLLNGAHSLLAYAGPSRGHTTVAEAIGDPVCRGWVEQWWDEASPYLTIPSDQIAAYRAALLERFANPRIRHLLAQIAMDGSQKLPVRVLPVLRKRRASGELPSGAITALGGWVRHLRDGTQVNDPRGGELMSLVGGDAHDAARAALGALDPGLAADAELVRAVGDATSALSG